MSFEVRDRKDRRTPGKAVLRFVLHLLLAVLLVLSLGCICASKYYNNITIDEVLFYLTMPFRGTAQQFCHAFIKWVLLPSSAIIIIFLFLMFPRKREIWLVNRKGKGISILPLRLPLPILSTAVVIWLSILLPAGDRLLKIRKVGIWDLAPIPPDRGAV